MNVAQSLDDFFEAKGFSCPLCLDPYSLSEKSKKPTLLSCRQHNVCIECITNLAAARDKKCPSCRENIVIDMSKIQTNSQTISSMETIKELWESMQGKAAPAAAAAAQAPAPVVVAPPVVHQLALPSDYQSFLLCDEVEKLKQEVVDMEAIFPEIIQAMNWHNVADELMQEYRTNSSQWVTLIDKEANKILGAARLKPIAQPTTWEVHWLGVSSDKKEEYLALYQALGQYVESLSKNNRDDWLNFTLSAFYNYDTEEKYMYPVIDKLRELNRNYDLETICKHWGVQKKLTLYPCRRTGHIQNNFILQQKHSVQSIKTLVQVLQPFTEKYLKELKLEVAITQWCSENSRDTYQIFDAFKSKPETFFVYTFGGRTQGFIQFQIKADAIDVTRCCLLGLSRKFAEHFIREFIDKIKPQLQPQKKQLCYSCYPALTAHLQDAIESGQLYLHQAS